MQLARRLASFYLYSMADNEMMSYTLWKEGNFVAVTSFPRFHGSAVNICEGMHGISTVWASHVTQLRVLEYCCPGSIGLWGSNECPRCRKARLREAIGYSRWRWLRAMESDILNATASVTYQECPSNTEVE